MATNYPGSLDSYSTKSAGNTIDQGHVNDPQDAIEAIEAKVGTGASTPASNKVLISDGAGASTWDTVDVANMVDGALDETHGGTGQTTIAQGEILSATGANTIGKLGVGTAGDFLKSAGAGANVAWANVDIQDYGTSKTTGTAKTLSTLKICYGTFTVGVSDTATITNLPFSGSTSYKVLCHRSKPTAGSSTYFNSINYISGASFSITSSSDGIADEEFAWLAIGT